MRAIGHCKACYHAIVFLRTNTGNIIPVNVETISVEEKAKYESGEEILFRFGAHISHFATCEKAANFRKYKYK